jgi:hypothetical protein
MKLYFNRKLIEMEWKSLMESDMVFYGTCYFKIKSIHRTDYHSLLKLRRYIPIIIGFIDVFKVKGVDNKELGLFDVEIIMHSNRLSKKKRWLFRHNSKCFYFEQSEKDKSELRDMLLETLIYS